VLVQPVPEKMRLEMLVETKIEILDGQSSYLFSNEPFEKRPGMTIEDFGLHSDAHFESRLLGNGRYISYVHAKLTNTKCIKVYLSVTQDVGPLHIVLAYIICTCKAHARNLY